MTKDDKKLLNDLKKELDQQAPDTLSLECLITEVEALRKASNQIISTLKPLTIHVKQMRESFKRLNTLNSKIKRIEGSISGEKFAQKEDLALMKQELFKMGDRLTLNESRMDYFTKK